MYGDLCMGKLLQLTTCGLKNLENSITLDFANLTINKGIKKAYIEFTYYTKGNQKLK